MRYIYVILSFFVLLGFSCDEIPPVLNPNTGGPDGPGPVEDQMRQVLIEEFTGVRCVNCPAGSQAIEVLASSYGHRLIPVSIHAGFFAQPYPESQQNLANSTGNAIQSLVGEPIGYPTAVINRTQFAGETGNQVGQSSWAGYVAEELIGEPSVKIDLQPSYDETSREVSLSVDLYVEENINQEDVRLSLYLIENNIVDLQLTPDSVQIDYVHKHVFRDAITSSSGDLLTDPLTEGSVVSLSFNYMLADEWVADESHIVGFVHLGGGMSNVLQAHEVKLIE